MPRVNLAEGTKTKTDVSVGMLLGTIAICGVLMLGSFGSSMAAGIAKVVSPTKVYVFANDATGTQISYGGTLKVAPFTFYASVVSTVVNDFQFNWVLTKGNQIINRSASVGGSTSMVKMELEPGNYVWTVSARPLSSSLSSSVKQTFKFTIAPNPICTDSDMNSNTGASDPFMKGMVTGLINGVPGSASDVCKSTKILLEYSCGNMASVVSQRITCSNGCQYGACQRGRTIVVGGATFKIEPGEGSVSATLHDGGGDMKSELIFISSNVKADYSVQAIESNFPKNAAKFGIYTSSLYPSLKSVVGQFYDQYLNASGVSVNYKAIMRIKIKYNKQVGTVDVPIELSVMPVTRTSSPAIKN